MKIVAWVFGTLAALALALFLFVVAPIIGIYNGLHSADQAVTAKWAQVQNQYQRRMDLIPNLVETVKGYAGHENRTLVQVREATASITNVKIDPSIATNPDALRVYGQAQANLSAAMPGLMMLGRQVQEAFPNLKADRQFTALMSSIEGTENRITVARMDFINAAQELNTKLVTFPNNIVNGFAGVKPRATFEADAAASKAPAISFK